MSMKIERSSLDQVKARFAQNKKRLEEKKKDYDLEQRVKELKEEVCFHQDCARFYLFHSTIEFINRIISVAHRKRRSKSIERKGGRTKKEKSKTFPRRMPDHLMKWPRSWDSLASVQRKNDKSPLLTNSCE